MQKMKKILYAYICSCISPLAHAVFQDPENFQEVDAPSLQTTTSQ